MPELKINIRKEQTFDWPVHIDVPEGGKHITRTFTGVFKILPHEDHCDKIITSAYIGHEEFEKIYDCVDQVFVGWKDDLKDEDGVPLQNNEENRIAIINHSLFTVKLYQAYYEALTGKGFKKGNSKR